MTELAVDIVHQNMHQRQSIGHLVEPAPNAEQLERAFQAALTAPDHHRLKSTRFIVRHLVSYYHKPWLIWAKRNQHN